jgi:hypothetical protein
MRLHGHVLVAHAVALGEPIELGDIECAGGV